MDEMEQDQRPPSRSELKRRAHAVEELAARLADLSDAEFRKITACQDVMEELEMARRVQGHGARRRQIKHLAAVLRTHEEDRQALESFLEGTDGRHRREQKVFHGLEALRDRLCDPATVDAALKEAADIAPGVDLAALQRLAGAASGSRDRRAYREIFRRLRDAVQEKGE